MKLSVKKGDNVVVIAGKDAGKTGEVLEVNKENGKVVVSQVNIQSHHRKPRNKDDKGGIIKSEGAIDVSNVQVICPVCGKATRVAHAEVEGKKVRVCKKCNASLDKEFKAKKDAKKVKAEDLKGAKLKATKKSATENKEEK